MKLQAEHHGNGYDQDVTEGFLERMSICKSSLFLYQK